MKKFFIVIAMALPLLSGCFIHHHDRGNDGYHRGHHRDKHDHGDHHRDYDRGHYKDRR